MVTGINGGYYPYQYQNTLDRTYYNPVQVQQPILTGGVSTTDPVNAKKDNTADGKDDGSIGFWGATKNLAKGAWNFLTSPFKNEKGEWSLKSTLKSLAIGAAFVVGNIATGGALTPILLAAGITFGTVSAVKAGYNIATAETDAQAEAAWQSMGSSATAVATSVIGARSYAKANGVDVSGFKGTKNAVVKTFQDAGTNIKSGKTYLFGQSAKAEVLNADGTVKTAARPEVRGKFGEYYDTYKNAKNAENGTYKAGFNAVKERAQAAGNARLDAANEQLIGRSKTYYDYKIDKAVNPNAKLTITDKMNVLKEAVANYAKNEVATSVGYTKGAGTLANAEAIVANPQNIAIYNSQVSNTVKPNFYDSLSKEEQAQFDSLPKAQREQLEDYYYSMV